MTDSKSIITSVTTAATTVAGDTAAGAVTKSSDLKAKTSIGVIKRDGEHETLTLSLYRQSSMASGQYSRDVYVLREGQWKFQKKDAAKYPEPPFAPAEAEHYVEGGVDVWTMEPMTITEKESLKRLLTQL